MNDFTPCILENASAGRRHQAIFELSATCLGEQCWDNIATMSQKWASTERQRLLALHPWQCKGCASTSRHNQTIGCLSRWKCFLRHHHCTLKITINGALTISGLAIWKINGLYCFIGSYSNYWLAYNSTILPPWLSPRNKVSINGRSTKFDLASWIIERRWNTDNP